MRKKEVLKKLKKAYDLARTSKVEGIGVRTFYQRARWEDVDATDFAEGYEEIIEGFWDEFAWHIREGRYVYLKTLQTALEQRVEEERGHPYKAALLRLSTLRDVLLHYEVFGYAPYWDEVEPQEKHKEDVQHSHRIRVGKALFEEFGDKPDFESIQELKEWVFNNVGISESNIQNIAGELWVKGQRGKRSSDEANKSAINIIEYYKEGGK